MIRFVDLRDQNTECNFAFWNTVTDEFISVAGTQAWDIYQEFEEECRADDIKYDFESICPKWALGYERPKNGLALGKIILDDGIDADGNQISQTALKKALGNGWLYSQKFKKVRPEPPMTYSFNDINFMVCDPAKTEHCQIPFALSKKLYDQNAAKYTQRYRIPGYSTQFHSSVCFAPPRTHISATMTAIDKYTIVELTYDGKHYQGLASRAQCDEDNSMTGIAIAYNRAFEKMMVAQGALPCKTQDTVDKIITDAFENTLEKSRVFFRKCLLGAYGLADEEVAPRYTTKNDVLKVIEQANQNKIKSEGKEYYTCDICKGRRPCHITITSAMSEHFDKEACLQTNSGFDAEWRCYGGESIDVPQKRIKEPCKEWKDIWGPIDNHHSAVVNYMQRCRPTCIKELSEMIGSTPPNEKISELIYDSILALEASGKKPTEIRIKPAASDKLRKELEVVHDKWIGVPIKYLGLKYIVDPSINVDVIII